MSVRIHMCILDHNALFEVVFLHADSSNHHGYQAHVTVSHHTVSSPTHTNSPQRIHFAHGLGNAVPLHPGHMVSPRELAVCCEHAWFWLPHLHVRCSASRQHVLLPKYASTIVMLTHEH